MASIADATCIDRFEAHLVETATDGSLRPWPANKPPGSANVRAASAPGMIPQAHVSQSDAQSACKAAGKRLCTDDEWIRACKGTPETLYPYGTRRRAGACNDRGLEPLAVIFKQPAAEATWGFDEMNDPRLQLVAGGVARTGRFDQCTNDLEVHDMVGNLHEWTASPSGTMRGGYYLDTTTLGEGCNYAALGHDRHYRDYSTGFRCCSDAPP
jgi:formylglycine-generating enzyme required for sulfatase activity